MASSKIEGILPGEQRSELRVPMVALYVLWHRFLSAQHHRPKARSVIDRFAKDLQAPSMVAFAVRVLVGDDIEWTDDELHHLVDTRRGELEKGRGQKLSARFDAALLLCLAERRWNDARDEALTLLSEAIESLPGDEGLIRLEAAAISGEPPEVDLLGFVLDAHAESADSDETANESGTDEQESEHAADESLDHPTENPRDNEK